MVVVVAVLLALQTGTTYGFALSPHGTKKEREEAKRDRVGIELDIFLTRAALHVFTDPVHEALTQRSMGCDRDWRDCADPDLEDAGPYVIAGVRWNDDPVFEPGAREAAWGCLPPQTISFITRTACWLKMFHASEALAAGNRIQFIGQSSGNMMQRSHFGDMQFLHAMAATEGERPDVTLDRVLMWAGFTWGVIEGRYGLGTLLREISLPGWTDFFDNGQRVQDLFTVGRPWLRDHIDKVAFGSLLHMVQDSFAEGHVHRREPQTGAMCADGRHRAHGPIIEFHSYASQNHKSHREADQPLRAQRLVSRDEPDAIDAGRTLRDMMRAQRTSSVSLWPEVKAYLAGCVFVLAPDARRASAGEAFR